jgi:hypothetical protein
MGHLQAWFGSYHFPAQCLTRLIRGRGILLVEEAVVLTAERPESSTAANDTRQSSSIPCRAASLYATTVSLEVEHICQRPDALNFSRSPLF